MGFKALIIFLIVCISILILPVYASDVLTGEDISKRVEVSEFLFTNALGEPINELIDYGTVLANCKIKRTDIGEGEQDYAFIMAIYYNGELVDIVCDEGVIDKSMGTIPLTLSYTLGNDASNYKIYTYLWSNLVDLDLLSNPASFGSSICELTDIKIDGNSIGTICSGVTEYDYEVSLSNSKIPKEIKVEAKDLSSKVEMTNITSFPGTINIKVTSHDNLHENIYRINMKTEPDKIHTVNAIKGAYKTYNATTWTQKGNLPFSSSDLWLRAASAAVTAGVSRVSFIEFDLSSLPENAVINSAKLTLNITSYASNEPSLEIYANLCTDPDWYNYDPSDIKGVPEYNSNQLMGSGYAFGTGLLDIELDVSQINSNKLVIALRRSYYDGEKDFNTIIDARLVLPKITISYGI